jgi:hypothetical protein
MLSASRFAGQQERVDRARHTPDHPLLDLLHVAQLD